MPVSKLLIRISLVFLCSVGLVQMQPSYSMQAQSPRPFSSHQVTSIKVAIIAAFIVGLLFRNVASMLDFPMLPNVSELPNPFKWLWGKPKSDTRLDYVVSTHGKPSNLGNFGEYQETRVLKSGGDSVFFTPCGTKLITASSEQHEISIWDSKEFKQRFTIPYRLYSAIACSADGQWLAMQSGDREVSLYNSADGKLASKFRTQDSIAEFGFHLQEKILGVVDKSGAIQNGSYDGSSSLNGPFTCLNDFRTNKCFNEYGYSSELIHKAKYSLHGFIYSFNPQNCNMFAVASGDEVRIYERNIPLKNELAECVSSKPANIIMQYAEEKRTYEKKEALVNSAITQRVVHQELVENNMPSPLAHIVIHYAQNEPPAVPTE